MADKKETGGRSGKKVVGSTKKKAKQVEVKRKTISKNKSAGAPVKHKIKIVTKKKRKAPVKSKAKNVAAKKTKITAKSNGKSDAERKLKGSLLRKSKPALPAVQTHGDDLHFIPEKAPIHPLTTIEVHQKENIFHSREEVALHQENQKIKEAMASGKSAKRKFRITGRR